MRQRVLFSILGLFFMVGPATAQITRYVDLNSADPTPPYTNWSQAAHDIQPAVNVATDGDTILIATGVYVVSSPVTVTNPIVLSGVGGRDAVVVDAQYQCSVIFVTNAGSRIEGLTLMRGGGDGPGVYGASFLVLSNCLITGCTNSGVYLFEGGTIQSCVISSNRSPDNAGGIWGEYFTMTDSQVLKNQCRWQGGGVNADQSVFSNCLFAGNIAQSDGGGLLCNGGQVVKCTIRGNRSDGSQGGGGGYFAGVDIQDCYVVGNTCSNIGSQAEGGGLLIFNSLVRGCDVRGNYSPYGGGIGCFEGNTITNCVIRDNQANTSGGGIWMDYGGAVFNSVIEDNIANGYGGGISMYYGGRAVDCLVSGNHGSRGGGIQSYHTGCVTRCVIMGNHAGTSGGGGIYFYADSSSVGGFVTNCLVVGNRSDADGGGVLFYRGGRVENCTIADNTASNSGGGVYGNTRGNLQNTIVYHNSSEYAGTLVFTNCCSTPRPSGTGNIDTEPVFINRVASDYRLATNSPCVNAGTNQDWMAGATDLGGAPRLVGPAVDMGAYELGTFRCNFSGTPTRGLSPLTVQFESWASGTNTAPVYYNWDFGDASGPGIEGWGSNQVEYVYTNSGLYSVQLEASNTVGGYFVITQTHYVTILRTNIHYVSGSGANVYPYDSWADAAWLVQDAVNACLPGGQVLVTNGTYDPLVHILVTNAIRVTSVNGPSATFIDGNNIRRGFYLDHSGVLVGGFTITNGNPIHPLQRGGGVWIAGGGTVSNCVITGCRTEQSGGGFYFESGGLLVDCDIIGNWTYGWGAGGYCKNGGDVLRCRIQGNVVSNYDGGGVYIDSTGSVRFCTIDSNWARYGGGAYCDGNAGLFENCWIRGNSGSEMGGGVFVSSDAHATIRNCAILGNSILRRGGGVYGGNLQNCTIVGNTSGETGGGTQNSSNRNCIVYYNTVNGEAQNTTGGVCMFTCTTPDPGGAGNIDAEPGLVSLTNPMITSNSPCVNAGSNAYTAGATDLFGNSRTNGASVDMGCHEFTASSLTGALSVVISGEFSNAVRGFELAFQGALVGNLGGYAWDFGDGAGASNSLFVNHTYASSAYYPLVLTVWNNDGAASVTVQVHIVDGYTNFVALTGAPLSPYTNWAQAARTIQDAIDANAYAGSHVLVGDGVYTQGGFAVSGLLNRVYLAKPLTVMALNPRQAIVAGGGENARCAYVNERGRLIGFTLSDGLTLTNGHWVYACSGGGLLLDGGGVASNCLIAASAAASGGGAHCYLGGELRNCDITANRSKYSGGGVMCTLGGTVEYCSIAGNICSNTPASGYGGGLFATNGGTIRYCMISNNYARYDGGGIYITRGIPVILSDCVIADNVAAYSGGGVFLLTTGWVTRCDIANNQTFGSGGGGVYLYQAGVVSNCAIRGNVGGSSGAGLYANDRGYVVQSIFSSNQTPYNGGGAYLYNYCCAKDCVFTDNRVDQNGGGIYLSGNSATSRNCRVEGNLAALNGGGVWHSSGTYVDTCLVRSNASGRGGGVYSYYGEVRNCLIADNSATNAGGGQYATYVVEQNCTLSGNVASNFGGGLYLTNRCVLTNVVAYGNLAASGSNYWTLSTNCVFGYSLSAPVPEGTSNLDLNPLFAGVSDYRLATNSPCVDSGVSQAWMSAGTDLEGKPRVLNGVVDRGAYEVIPPSWDSNTNGMPDWWEWDYSHNMTGMVAGADDDGDDFVNLDEYYAGTIPTDDSSYLGLLAVQTTGATTGMIVRWQSVAGKLYNVDRTTNLLVDPAFTNMASGVVGQANGTSVTDTTATASGPCFYRVRLE